MISLPERVEWEEVSNTGNKEGFTKAPHFHTAKQRLERCGLKVTKEMDSIFGTNPIYSIHKKGAKRRYLLNTEQIKAAALFAIVLGVER